MGMALCLHRRLIVEIQFWYSDGKLGFNDIMKSINDLVMEEFKIYAFAFILCNMLGMPC